MRKSSYTFSDALLLIERALPATNGPCLLHVRKKKQKKLRGHQGIQKNHPRGTKIVPKHAQVTRKRAYHLDIYRGGRHHCCTNKSKAPPQEEKNSLGHQGMPKNHPRVTKTVPEHAFIQCHIKQKRAYHPKMRRDASVAERHCCCL